MNSARDTVKYDRNSNTISFKGTAIIDMSLVPETAKATFYSGVTIDFQGFDTVLKFDSTKMPFDLQVAAFNATGFIRAIVENRLEVEGMVVSNVIQKAYEYLRENDLINKRSSSVGAGGRE